MTNHVGIIHTSKLPGSSIQGSFGMLVSDRTKKICPNYHQEFCNRIKYLSSAFSHLTPPAIHKQFPQNSRRQLCYLNSNYDKRGQDSKIYLYRKAEVGVVYKRRNRIIAQYVKQATHLSINFSIYQYVLIFHILDSLG